MDLEVYNRKKETKVKTAEDILEKARQWTTGSYDGDTQAYIQNLIDTDDPELTEAFYKNLEFGTGGMRGIMGLGTNRINQYTLGMATQGLSNYILESFPGEKHRVAISYDCRNNSDRLAKIVANVFSANGIEVFLYEDLRPTPQLSWTVRHLNCHSGIMLTASHNPKEYNGYKVYWNDGAQIVPPHDKNIIAEVEKITSPDQVKFEPNEQLIHFVGEELDKKFIDEVVSHSMSTAGVEDLKVVFTSLHGTSIKSIPAALEKAGYKRVFTVAEQAVPNGNFPTVESPNPEEPEALDMALDLATSVEGDIVIGTDPDGDRIGLAVRDQNNLLRLLNGNQAGAVLTWYLLKKWTEKGLSGNEYVASTIVTSDLIIDIAKGFGVDCPVSLTGFKWIADIIRRREATHTFIGGGEESYGYMIGDFVRDKDAVTSTLIACEIAAWAKSQGRRFFDILLDIYEQYGLYKERLISIVKKGKSGAEEIAEMMRELRANPPKQIAGKSVVRIDDVQKGTSLDVATGRETPLELPASNVLQFYTEDGSKISARPSGTEPKIKFYISVKGKLTNRDEFAAAEAAVEKQIDAIISDLKLG